MDLILAILVILGVFAAVRVLLHRDVTWPYRVFVLVCLAALGLALFIAANTAGM